MPLPVRPSAATGPLRAALPIGALIVACLCTAPARAQTVPAARETVTVTGTVEPVPFDTLSRAVYVVTADDLARLPVDSIADALALLAPVDVRSRGVAGVQADFSVRGGAFGQTLVLVDGVRINDAQSGHHNADIPVPLDEVERIEVLAGGGSSLHGADALGGTINIVTRRGRQPARVEASGGSFGTWEGRARADWGRAAFAGSVARSDGFMFDRDYSTAALSGRVELGGGLVARAGFLDRAFGANGFYGASPSKEWTSQWLASLERTRAAAGPWRLTWRAAVRSHRDRFLWDVRRPGVLENLHRSHAISGTVHAERSVGAATRLTVGADAGGDWVRSTNLGDHAYARGAVFGQLLHRRGRAFVSPALRIDRYSRFGGAVSPSIAAGAWLGRVKLRGSAGHAFRVPTFTELYYRDPAHEAGGALEPERAWSVEGGADLLAGAWQVGATGFVRLERDVIDWVRASPDERWRTVNVRRATTPGLELTARRSLGDGHAELQYAWLDTRARGLDLLSKYVLDFARHRVAGALTARVGSGTTIGVRVGYTRRVDRRAYLLADARLARRIGAIEIFADGRNLLGERYQEIAGVDMPGRSARVGLRWRGR
jgi:iron complex outermembrane receptor protein